MDPRYKQHKHPFWGDMPLSTSGPLECALTGVALLRNPYFNKGSAFTARERKDFQLHGLLPPHVQTLEEQVKRAYKQYSERADDLAKNTFMNSMRTQNEVLFYRVRFFTDLTIQNGELIPHAAHSRSFERDVSHHLHPN